MSTGSAQGKIPRVHSNKVQANRAQNLEEIGDDRQRSPKCQPTFLQRRVCQPWNITDTAI